MKARIESQKERDRALEAERSAADHLSTATREKQRADTHAQELRQRLYDYNISKAYSAFHNEQLTTAASFLAECLPEQRGWEWSYIHRLCKASRSISLASNSTLGFVWAPDGRGFITSDQEGVVRSVGILDGRVQWSQESEIWQAADSRISPTGDRLLIVGSRAPTNPSTTVPVAVIQSLSSVDGKLLWTEHPTAAIVYEPSFSPDGTQFLVSVGTLPAKSTAIELRSFQTGQLIW